MLVVVKKWSLSWVLLVGLTDTSVGQQAIALFDGRSLHGWTTEEGRPVTQGWEVVDGMLHLSPGNGGGGNIVSVLSFCDFVLDFEWKIAAEGNNGIKYRVRDYGGRMLGCEYQLIDDEHSPDVSSTKQLTGALYDVYEPIRRGILRPAGQFNQSRIVVRGQHIEHWLNGHAIMVAEVGSPEWRTRIGQSKFWDVPCFGYNRAGKIMITDHHSEVWIRSMMIYVLPPVPDPQRGVYPVASRAVCGAPARSKFLSRVFLRRCGQPRFVRRSW